MLTKVASSMQEFKNYLLLMREIENFFALVVITVTSKLNHCSPNVLRKTCDRMISKILPQRRCYSQELTRKLGMQLCMVMSKHLCMGTGEIASVK